MICVLLAEMNCICGIHMRNRRRVRLQSTKQRLSSWAEQRADQLAEAQVRERLIEERMKRANRS